MSGKRAIFAAAHYEQLDSTLAAMVKSEREFEDALDAPGAAGRFTIIGLSVGRARRNLLALAAVLGRLERKVTAARRAERED